MNSVYFSIACFFFLLIFAVVYFSKQRIKLQENRVYVIILILTIFGTIFDMFGCYCFSRFSISSLINLIIVRVNLFYYVIWIFVFFLYVLIISFQNRVSDLPGFYFKIKVFSLFFFFLSCLMIMFLPLQLKYNINEVYPYGMAVNVCYILSFIEISAMIFCVCKNIKNIKKKQYIPLFTFLGIGIIAIVIQQMHPSFHLLILCESIVTSLMYFTIENPDMQMVERLEKSKNEADRANRAKTDFLSSMSHEIRTPLNAIVGFSDCIVNSNSLTDAKENAKDIVNASKTLLEIVNGILDISKIESGKMELVCISYDSRAAFREVANLLIP